MRFLIIVTIALFVGCSAPGDLISKVTTDAPPRMGKAPVDGDYGLFISGQSEQLEDFQVKKDSPIGFEFHDDGAVRWLFAVAGNARLRVRVDENYEWRRLPQ